MIDGRCFDLLARLVFQDLIFGTPSCEILHSSGALTIVQNAKYCIHVISTPHPWRRLVPYYILLEISVSNSLALAM